MADIRIAPIAPPSIPATVGGTLSPRNGGDGFGDVLAKALTTVNELQLDARDAALSMASGTGVDSAQALVTIEKANVSFQFALQVRNKLLEAYQEIMRMAV